MYVESKLEDECCPELASGRPALLGAPHWRRRGPARRSCPAERHIQLYRTRDAAQYVVHAIDAIGFSSQARVGPA